MMESVATEVKNQLVLNLLIQVLEERGIMSESELQERLTNKINLSSMNSHLKEEVLQEIKTASSNTLL